MTTPEATAQNWIPEPPEPPDPGTFGGRLKLIRMAMGWNAKEAALACGLPAQSWRGWEVDGREPHRLITIAMAIAGRTGVDVDWLVWGPDRKVRNPMDRYGPKGRVVATVGAPSAYAHESAVSADLNYSVTETRPVAGRFVRSSAAANRQALIAVGLS